MIKREKYISEIRGFYDSDLIKIITGVRRCGKSVVLEQVMDEIRQKSDNIVFLHFEDRLITEKINTWKDIVTYVEDRRTSGLCYVFLDEVQEIADWQIACKTLRLRKCSVFITGSNSKLLSGEFTTELSGRYVSFRIRPFVFKEVIEYAKELGKTVSETDYLIWGGFPKRIEFNTDYMKSQGIPCTSNTVQKWIGYLSEAYIIDQANRFSRRAKKKLEQSHKLYNCDVALNSIRCEDKRFDLTHNLENIIYNELLYMGYNVSVYDNNGREIDFLAEKSNLRCRHSTELLKKTRE